MAALTRKPRAAAKVALNLSNDRAAALPGSQLTVMTNALPCADYSLAAQALAIASAQLSVRKPKSAAALEAELSRAISQAIRYGIRDATASLSTLCCITAKSMQTCEPPAAMK